MKVGFNMLLWTTHVTEDDLPLLEAIKKAGYDGVEIPIFEGDPAHFEKIGQAIKNNGLGCTSVTVIPDEEHNPVSADAGNRGGTPQVGDRLLAGAELRCLVRAFLSTPGRLHGRAPHRRGKAACRRGA